MSRWVCKPSTADSPAPPTTQIETTIVERGGEVLGRGTEKSSFWFWFQKRFRSSVVLETKMDPDDGEE